MSDYELKRINALTEASAINDSDVFAIDSANGTKKVAWETLKGEVDADISEAVSSKADKDGTYPDMAVGSVLGTNTVTDKEPYFLRPSASIGDREFDTLVGGTLGWNQLVQNGNFADTSNWSGLQYNWKSYEVDNNVLHLVSTANQSATVNISQNIASGITPNHVYIILFSIKASKASTFSGSIGTSAGGGSFANREYNADVWTEISSYCKPHTYTDDTLYFRPKTSVDTEEVDVYLKNINLIDLTTLFGSTIADYIYSLETAHTGDGVAWVKKYLPNAYYAYCAPTLKHVSGVSAHVMRDANNNVIGNYPIDSTWVGMGIPKLDSANKLYFDGDTYASDGTVTERFGIRAYQSGDESLADAITDGTNTVYKLTTPTTSSASPFTSPQICDKDGTEEYVTTGLVPVGHETEYVENLADKLTDIPDLPTTAGTYSLKVTVSGGVPSYSWVSA